MTKSATTLMLSEKEAERLDRIVKSGGYPSREAAVSEALDALEDPSWPGLEDWLQNVVAKRYDDFKANPTVGITIDEARRRLLGPKKS